MGLEIDGAKAGQARLKITPLSIREAKAYVSRIHRHHRAPQGGKFALAVSDDQEQIRGVSIVGRPVSRMLDDGWTAEVIRLATDGCPNACSSLYAASWRAARAMGYRKLITYVLGTETGVSLSAAGWKCVGETGGGTWDRKDRPRVDLHPTQGKFRWEVA